MIVRAGPQLTKEELEKKIGQITSKFPHAKIIPLEDGVKIGGISQQEEDTISIIIAPTTTAQPNAVQPAPTPPKVLSQESASGENEFALVAKKVFSNIAQEKITLAEKTMQEKIDEIFGKIEERNMFWSNSWNDFTRQLAAIDKQFTEFMTTLEALNQKIAIMEKSWEDERSKQNGEVASNLADHKKFAESFAKVVQYLREIPIPK